MDRKYHIISANGVSLGRVATAAAKLLMGKHKPEFVPNKDVGDFVRVSEYANVRITGDKLEQKIYYRPTKRVGALKSESLKKVMAERPTEALRRAVWGMLPKNTLRKQMIKRLNIE